jgi:ATPase family protein associated with various cellular activities (AAA)/winged helix domain-containing protein
VNDLARQPDWTEANQQLLVAEFARLRAKLTGASDAEEPTQLAAAAAAMPAPPAIERVVELFGLSQFERSLLLLCAGAEMDSKLAAACRLASGGEARGAVSFGFALAALEDPHWSAIAPSRPLRRWRLIDLEPGWPLTEAPLRIDERMLHFLAGINQIDSRLQPLLALPSTSRVMDEEQSNMADAVARAWSQEAPPWTPVHLAGEDAHGAEDVAAAAAAELGLQLLVLQAGHLPAGASELDTFIALWQREAALLPAALLLLCPASAPGSSVTALAERARTPLFIASRDPFDSRRATLDFELRKPGIGQRKRLWRETLGGASSDLNGTLDLVASQFQFSAQVISTAADRVLARVAAGESTPEALWSTCRTAGRSRLEELAQRIPRGASWEDLVLPPAQTALLRQIAAQVRNRLQVYDDWGFGRRSVRGLGVAALFSGESGTGKTLAAEVLAAELNLDLYRIDLSSVVSKYIGETEKNLRRVFDAAEESGAVLLFDEADALFGKRSEVRDSHDRYANIEVSYLLQRMEAYRGLAILTTNFKSALDPAFQRRLRFFVHFPFPDARQREAIWRRAFPSAAPTSGIDFVKLARLHIPGGGIRNIALNAAFLAADEGAPVAMRHLLQAAHTESAKLERPLSETETRGWA